MYYGLLLFFWVSGFFCGVVVIIAWVRAMREWSAPILLDHDGTHVRQFCAAGGVSRVAAANRGLEPEQANGY